MVTSGGPDIVNDGLVLHLDAADRKSYPGTGNWWYDLSGNANDCLLVNTPTHSFQNKGYFSFDGVNEYAQAYFNLTLSTITYEFWGYFDDSNFNMLAREESAFGDWATITGNTTRVHFGTRWTGSSAGMHFNTNGQWQTTPVTNLKFGWNHYLLTYNGSVVNTKRVYLNGIESSSYNSDGPITMDSFKIGVATGLNRYYRGNISLFKLYNRYFSAEEALINYRAMKGRYGL